MSFKTDISSLKKVPILFEVDPPNKSLPNNQVNLFINQVLDFIKKTKVAALLIPEIVPESKRNAFALKEKVEPRALAKKIWKSSNKFDIFISRVVVYHPEKQLRKWLSETYHVYGIKKIVLVGGEKEACHYSGLSVTQASELLKKLNLDYSYGGITIPTRNNEPKRIIDKQKAGINFFISQIICEPETTIKLLKDYFKACQKENLRPARIFLSFAPISTPKDIKFMESLGILIPSSAKKDLLKVENKMAEKSINLAKEIFRQILAFVQKNKVKVPLGINIGYLTKRNFILSQKMVKCFNQ